MSDKTRCHWVKESSDILKKYHDEEFSVPQFDDDYLFEILVLVNFQTGLSWEIMLIKREAFREAFDGFDVEKVANYDDEKIEELLSNESIIRNRNKINAVINNAQIFFCALFPSQAARRAAFKNAKTANQCRLSRLIL